MVGGGEPPGAALEDGALKKPPGQRSHQVICGGEASSRLPIDGDHVRVASKLPNVFLDPGEGHHLVPDPSITGNILSAKGEEAQQTQAISAKYMTINIE